MAIAAVRADLRGRVPGRDGGEDACRTASQYFAENEIRNRGVEDILIFAVDNLTGISEAIEAVYPQAEIQKCIVHQIRNSLRFVSWKER